MCVIHLKPGNKNKGKGNGDGLRKPVTLLCRRVPYHTLFCNRHIHMTTVKESAEQCRQLQ